MTYTTVKQRTNNKVCNLVYVISLVGYY